MKISREVQATEYGDNRTPNGSVSELQGAERQIRLAIDSAWDLLSECAGNDVRRDQARQMLQLAMFECDELRALIEPELAT
jgi:hypothetical protein